MNSKQILSIIYLIYIILDRFYGMKNSGGYYVIVVEDLNCGKVVGSATLVVEQKFIHSCGLVSTYNNNLSCLVKKYLKNNLQKIIVELKQFSTNRIKT